MPTPPDPSSSFRHTATRIYWVVCAFLVVLVIAAACLGWRIRGWWGLTIATVIALVVAVVVWAGVTLLYAMSQDGA